MSSAKLLSAFLATDTENECTLVYQLLAVFFLRMINDDPSKSIYMQMENIIIQNFRTNQSVEEKGTQLEIPQLEREAQNNLLPICAC